MGMLFYFSVVSPSVRKISSISWFNLHLFTVKTLKVQVFLAHLGNFLEKHFNMLSTHTHTHTHIHNTPMIYLLFLPIKLSFQNQDWSGIWNQVSPVMLNEGEQSLLILVCVEYCSPICILQPSKECKLKAWGRTRKNCNNLGTNWKRAGDSLYWASVMC